MRCLTLLGLTDKQFKVQILTQKDNLMYTRQLGRLGSGFCIIFDDALAMHMWFNNYFNFLSQSIRIRHVIKSNFSQTFCIPLREKNNRSIVENTS